MSKRLLSGAEYETQKNNLADYYRKRSEMLKNMPGSAALQAGYQQQQNQLQAQYQTALAKLEQMRQQETQTPAETVQAEDAAEYYRKMAKGYQSEYETQKSDLTDYHNRQAENLKNARGDAALQARLGYQQQQNLLQSQYRTALANLDASRQQQKAEAAIAYERLKKYMPNLLKQQGLSGTGLAGTAQVSAYHNYMAALGKAQNAYDTNSAALSAELSNNLSAAQASLLSAIAQANNQYSSGLSSLDQGQQEKLMALYSDYAAKRDAANENAYQQEQAEGDAYYAELLDMLENGRGSGDDFSGTGTGGLTTADIASYYKQVASRMAEGQRRIVEMRLDQAKTQENADKASTAESERQRDLEYKIDRGTASAVEIQSYLNDHKYEMTAEEESALIAKRDAAAIKANRETGEREKNLPYTKVTDYKAEYGSYVEIDGEAYCPLQRPSKYVLQVLESDKNLYGVVRYGSNYYYKPKSGHWYLLDKMDPEEMV